MSGRTLSLRKSSASQWWPRPSTLVGTAVMLLMCILGHFTSLQLQNGDFHNSRGGMVVDSDRISLSGFTMTSLGTTKTRGRQIVEKAFEASYADVVDFCGTLNQTAATSSLQVCLNSLYSLQTQKGSPFAAKWPWWFQTMIRDARLSHIGLFGPWHFLQFNETPPMQLCVYEKGGTKLWRIAHCRYMQSQGINITGTTPTNCFRQQGDLPKDNRPVQRSVFLRDPLERYLSGFLDKCADKLYRQHQAHCQPSIIFQDEKNKQVADFFEQAQKLFEVHVDVSPLQWDLHFMPLSFQCGGLYQTIQDYDFVGKMDHSFYQDLDRFAQRYPTLKAEVQLMIRDKKGEDRKENVGIERQAALFAQQYFTPNTVRKVLQYYAVDYMMLGLDIPQWAEDILKQDETFLV